MVLEKVSLNCGFITLYFESDKGLLFHHHRQTLELMPSHALVILMLIDQGLTDTDIVNELAHHVDTRVSNQLLSTLRSYFTDLPTDSTYHDGLYPEVKNSPGSLLNLLSDSAFSLESVRNFELAGSKFSVFSESDELLSTLENVVQYSPTVAEKDNIDFVVVVKGATTLTGCYDVFINGYRALHSLEASELLAAIIDRLQVIAYQNTDYQLCFHGASLSFEGTLVLLPGKSGSGKSTLCAALAPFAHSVYSDEYILFNEAFMPIGVELPIVVKKGSWKALATRYMSLKQQTCYQRIDGRSIKYIAIDKEKYAKQNVQKVVILFPIYTQDIDDVALQPLSTLDALTQMISAGYQIAHVLDEPLLDRLLETLQNAQKFQLRFCSLESAEKTILRLIKEKRLGE